MNSTYPPATSAGDVLHKRAQSADPRKKQLLRAALDWSAKPQGRAEGIIRSDDGTEVYKGELNDNREPDGNGILWKVNAWAYRGNFVEGRPQGRGELFDAHGRRMYWGDVVAGIPHGLGIRFDDKGGTYHGVFKHGQFEGQGIHHCGAGEDTFYTGQHCHDMRHGSGAYFASGESYVGNWVQGQRHGRGQAVLVETFEDGTHGREVLGGVYHDDELIQLNASNPLPPMPPNSKKIGARAATPRADQLVLHAVVPAFRKEFDIPLLGSATLADLATAAISLDARLVGCKIAFRGKFQGPHDKSLYSCGIRDEDTVHIATGAYLDTNVLNMFCIEEDVVRWQQRLAAGNVTERGERLGYYEELKSILFRMSDQQKVEGELLK